MKNKNEQNKIKELREKRGWTQADLAKWTGYSRVYINRLEKGKVPNPSITILKEIACLFGRKIEEIWK
jgi:putative transcriptional regulator